MRYYMEYIYRQDPAFARQCLQSATGRTPDKALVAMLSRINARQFEPLTDRQVQDLSDSYDAEHSTKALKDH